MNGIEQAGAGNQSLKRTACSVVVLKRAHFLHLWTYQAAVCMAVQHSELNSIDEFFLSTSRDSINNMELTRKMLMLMLTMIMIHIRFTSPFLNPTSEDTD